MLLIAVLLFGGVVLVFLLVATIGIVFTTGGRWTNRMSQVGKIMWLTGYVLVCVLCFLLLGPAVFLSAWPLWGSMLLIVSICFALADAYAHVGWFKPRQASSRLEDKLAPYEGLAAPHWLNQTVEHGVSGWEHHDGKLRRKA